ncbi:MAG: hypothetical protein JOY62_12735 [Acidobacteriaceae bacterium]|nr:hypothetical protein [Acidobacteriaceae bacterium]MBV9780826.1 hypothetical protein [Acidobacteriaceae bacterium]
MKFTWLVLSVLAIGTVCLGGSMMCPALQASTPRCNVERIAGFCNRATASGVLVVAAAKAIAKPSVEVAPRSMWGE